MLICVAYCVENRIYNVNHLLGADSRCPCVKPERWRRLVFQRNFLEWSLVVILAFAFFLQVRSALSGLEELDLSDLRYLSDLTFNRLTGCTPHLRRLSLAGCHIAFEFDPYRGCPAGAVENSSALLSLRNLRRLLTEQKGTLVALDLSRTSISPESLRSIAQVRVAKMAFS